MGAGGRASLLAIVVVSLLASAACGGTEQARGNAAVADPEPQEKTNDRERTPAAKAIAANEGKDRAFARADDAKAGGAAAQAGVAKAGAAKAGAATVVKGDADVQTGGTGGAESKDNPREVTLKITGDPGTEFSGTCSVGGEKRPLSGRVPHLYTFEPGGEKLDCEVRKEDEGALGIVLSDGEGVRSEQRTGAGEGTVAFSYSNGSLSSISSVSINQAVTSTVRSSSDDSR